MVHPTYGYLERRIRVASLTWLQWTQLLSALLGAYVLSRVLPLAAPYNLSVALTVCGLPAAWSLVATNGEIDVRGQITGWWRWRRMRGLYLSGGEPAPPARRAAAGRSHPSWVGTGLP